MRSALSALVFIALCCPVLVRAEPKESMRDKYIAYQVSQYGPLECGNTIAQFRLATKRQMEEAIAAQSREKLFATSDGRPYPFEQIYIEDLIDLRDLLNINDDPHRDAWDEEIRKMAVAAYERIKREGLLR